MSCTKNDNDFSYLCSTEFNQGNRPHLSACKIPECFRQFLCRAKAKNGRPWPAAMNKNFPYCL